MPEWRRLTETVENGVTTFTYATPGAVPGPVSISLDAEGETSLFYEDGIVYFLSVTSNGYSCDPEMALAPEWFRAEILQEELDGKRWLKNRRIADQENLFIILNLFPICDIIKRAIRKMLLLYFQLRLEKKLWKNSWWSY